MKKVICFGVAVLSLLLTTPTWSALVYDNGPINWLLGSGLIGLAGVRRKLRK